MRQENRSWGRSGTGAVPAAAAALVLAAFATFGVMLLSGPADASSATASGSKTVTMDHFKFSPASLHVAKGTRIVFANTSKVTHTATLKGSFDTGKVKPGKAVAVKFTSKGAYAYRCTLHPEMRGTIQVG